MYNTEAMKNISIEQFAAFLDGNLPEEEMQSVAMVIDANEEYSDILGDVMHVNDTAEVYMSQSDLLPEEYIDMDFDLPVVPEFAEVEDAEGVIELTAANDMEQESVELHDMNEVHLTMASGYTDEVEEPMNSYQDEAPHEQHDSEMHEDYNMEPNVDDVDDVDVL